MDEYINKTKFEELMHKKSRNYFDLYYDDKIREHYNKAIGYSLAADEAHDFPSADIQPMMHGKWITGDQWWTCRCSNCYHEFGIAVVSANRQYLFCPHCGAKMIKDGEKNG